jgi:GH35 family endo-1,4-beta-xylanase
MNKMKKTNQSWTKPAIAICLFALTSFAYDGRDPNAPWRGPAEERIDQIRKAGLTVEVRDAAGNPVPGAAVQVEMTRHAFPFGSAVATQRMLGSSSDSVIYRERVKELFNEVVMEYDVQWGSWEGNRTRGWSGVQWLLQHGFPVRGHNLVWPSWRRMPADVETLANDPAALRARVDNHIAELASTFAGQLIEWDVLNEPYSERDLVNVLGQYEMVRWFQIARAHDPHALLYVNDYNILEVTSTHSAHQNFFFNTIQYLIDNDAPLGGIGMQGHFQTTLVPPATLLSTLDRFSTFGLPIKITEFDINNTDELLQADYTRDFMTTVFSHPQVNGILMWGFWEGRHWRPASALFRQNWSIKPNGVMWTNLVFGEWWTRTNGVASEAGEFSLRGFKGDYRITVSAEDLTKKVHTALGSNSVITVFLGAAPHISIASPTNQARITAGEAVAVTTTAEDPDGMISRIEFFANDTKVGETGAPPFDFLWNNPPAGRLALTARAVDRSGMAVTSSPVHLRAMSPPRFQSSKLAIQNGLLRLQVEKDPAHDAVLHRSMDLEEWTPVHTNQAVTGQFLFAEPASGAGRFYRVEARERAGNDSLLEGLVSWWPLDVVHGVSTPDRISGNHLFLHLMGAANLVPGRHGNALSFDGATQFLGRVHARENGLPIYGATNYTVALWVRGQGAGQLDRRVFSESSDNSFTPLLNIGTDRDGVSGVVDIFLRNDSSTPHNHTRSFGLAFDSTWRHIAWVDRNGAAQLYIDGVLDGRNFNYDRGVLTANILSIGAILRSAPIAWFKGTIDEVALWERALSASEIREVMENGLGALGIPE